MQNLKIGFEKGHNLLLSINKKLGIRRKIKQDEKEIPGDRLFLRKI
jgi:hypothetical protein